MHAHHIEFLELPERSGPIRRAALAAPLPLGPGWTSKDWSRISSRSPSPAPNAAHYGGTLLTLPGTGRRGGGEDYLGSSTASKGLRL